MELIKKYWNEKPLAFVLFTAFFVRMVSVIFSKGYGMHDDHFFAIEAVGSWADGYDYTNWLPTTVGVEKDQALGHSLLYPGLNYFLFLFLKFIHITEPQSQMYVMRFEHALLSLITVYCGYKITLKFSDEKQAKMVGLLLAVFWFMPFLSVRNLIEVVCIAPMIIATWLVIKNWEKDKMLVYVVAGLLLGLAFSIRFQTITFTGGFGLALLFSKKIKEAIIVGFFFLLSAAGAQGLIDYFIFGQPFVEFREYVRYNVEHANDYITQPWYIFLLFIAGILIPPVSLFLLFGYFKNWKKQLILFLPSFIFLAFHSYFPNKQERFILPIIPFIIISGYMGWTEFVSNSAYWAKHSLALKRIWIFFWVLNIIALSVVSVAYSKRSRVEAMVYLSHKKDLQRIAIEDTNHNEYIMPPIFYLDKWEPVYGITARIPVESFYEQYKSLPDKDKPNYVVFMQEENIEARIANLKKYFPTLTYETTVEPSFIDRLVHWLNPINKNETSYIYKIK